MTESSIIKQMIEKNSEGSFFIFIGLGDSIDQNKKIVNNCIRFQEKNDAFFFLISSDEESDAYYTDIIADFDIYKPELDESESNLTDLAIYVFDILKNADSNKSAMKKMNFIKFRHPEVLLCSVLLAVKDRTSNDAIKSPVSVIRGSLSSSKVLKSLKDVQEELGSKKRKPSEFVRIALLEEIKGHQFFFAPVGIDEASNIDGKSLFIRNILELLRLMNIDPKIAVLSGGRSSDLGRDAHVDDTINQTTAIVKNFRDKIPNLDIKNSQILIEKTIDEKSNFILAPDGISGNLIYRTLVHLGGGQAFGALYSGFYLKYGLTLIDCSRNGKDKEIYGSMVLAKFFSTLRKDVKK